MEFENVMLDLAKLPKNEAIVGPDPDKEFVKSIEMIGLIYPIVVTEYKKKLYLIDGGRRIKAYRQLEKTEIPAKVYKNQSPVDLAVWTIVLNEQRSLNVVAEYQYYKSLSGTEKWEEIQKDYGLNKAHVNKVLSLGNLKDEKVWFSALQSGKITENIAFEIAKLGETRQTYLADLLDQKGKITATNIKEANQLRQYSTIADLQLPEMPTPNEAHVSLYCLVTIGEEHGMVFTDLQKAYQEKAKSNSKLYKLVEV